MARNGQIASTSDRIGDGQQCFCHVAAWVKIRAGQFWEGSLKKLAGVILLAVLPCTVLAQQAMPPTPAKVAQAVREYRMDNEDRIIRELSEFLAIPNVASDTPNIQKNAGHLVEMLEARGIETHLLPISGRGPVVFGKLISPE